MREMQVDQSVLEPGMPKQKLNGREIGTGFQHVSRTAVPQRMRECGLRCLVMPAARAAC